MNSTDTIVKQIRTQDASAMSEVSSALGSGDALKSKINTALKAEGLRESSGVSPVAVSPVATPEPEQESGALHRPLTPMWGYCMGYLALLTAWNGFMDLDGL